MVAAATRLSRVDGEAGQLILRGYAVEDLAPLASFEDVAYLLLYGKLPDAGERTEFVRDLASRRKLPDAAIALLRDAAAARTPPIDSLRMAAGTFSLGCSGNPGEDALTAIAAFPTVLGAYWRLMHGREPLPIRPELSHAAHCLYQTFGGEPDAARVRALETYWNTVADHGLNASTFTCRVIASTRSDLISAVTGALGALKGPLHGGAPGPVLDMVREIGTADRAELVLRARLDRGERLMGFGHRIYKVRDPRADVLAFACEKLYASGGASTLYELARAVEDTARRLLAEYKPGRRLDTNVEFYTALLLDGLGFPNEMFTPAFAAGRVVGWSAHFFEQLQEGRLIRPQSTYTGPEGLRYQAAAS